MGIEPFGQSQIFWLNVEVMDLDVYFLYLMDPSLL